MQQPRFAPQVTVVVPTRNSDRTLRACLQSIRGQLDADGATVPLELIVVDNHSRDTTAQVARHFADRLIVAGPERSAQRNLGTAAGHAPYVAFIDSDQVLEPAVVADAIALLDRRPEVGVVVVPETCFGDGFWVRCRMLERRATLGDARTEAGRFYRRDALEALGGFDEGLTGPEDWELHDRMTAAGWQVGRTNAAIHHDEGRVTLRSTFAKKRYYGRWLTPYRQLPWARSTLFSPRRVVADPAVMIRRPVIAGGVLVLKTVEAVGAALGARAGVASIEHRTAVLTEGSTGGNEA